MIEAITWRVVLRNGGDITNVIPLVATDPLEEYLQIDDKLYRLRWQQAKMREAEYTLVIPVRDVVAGAT